MTEKQREASRLNGRRSNGPKTKEGKARSSLNALKHGAQAKTLVLPDEDPQELENLRNSLDDQFDPQTPCELGLVQELATFRWQMLRVQKVVNAMLLNDPTCSENIALLDRLGQMETRFQRAAYRPYQALERLRAQRMKQVEKAEKVEAAEKKSQEPEFFKGQLWGDETDDLIEANCPTLKFPDGHIEPLYPGDPRRKQYGWNFEPDREHSYEWDPKNDPWRKPGDPLNQRPAPPPKNPPSPGTPPFSPDNPQP